MRKENPNEVILYTHCDMWKSHESMRLPAEVYANTLAGRKALLRQIMSDIKDGSVEIEEGYEQKGMENFLLAGTYITEVSDSLRYAYLQVSSLVTS